MYIENRVSGTDRQCTPRGFMQVIPSLSSLIKPVCFKPFLLAVMAAVPSTCSYVNDLKGDLGVHDPVMIREGNVYRVYYTGGLIGSKTSTDRITWKNAGSGLAAPGWITTYVPGNNGTDFWAPDISFRDNKYWLYYNVEGQDNDLRMV